MALNLTGIVLSKGTHATREQGVSVMEAAAWLAGEQHTHEPESVCPVLVWYCLRLNDALPDDKRQRLIPLLPRLIRTAGDRKKLARQYLAVDWLIRVHTPAWLDAVNLKKEAKALRELRQIVNPGTLQAAMPAAKAAQDAAWANGQANRNLSNRAVEQAAREVEEQTMVNAVWNAAFRTNDDVDRMPPMGLPDGDTRASSEAASKARSAGWAAILIAMNGPAMRPTVNRLQDAGVDLYQRMISL
ncbi:hypothetical protein [Nonomuraea sp. NPDC023979]|uniref:hypothetical protein n=1 Tax=Nonomuraea sp. NPDC023979 TaxID=3154796 RepID=UPI0033E15BE6